MKQQVHKKVGKVTNIIKPLKKESHFQINSKNCSTVNVGINSTCFQKSLQLKIFQQNTFTIKFIKNFYYIFFKISRFFFCKCQNTWLTLCDLLLQNKCQLWMRMIKSFRCHLCDFFFFLEMFSASFVISLNIHL